MRRKIALFFLIICIALSAASCGDNDKYDGYKEVYSVDSKYYFYVQPQYAESVSNLGYSDTVIIRYTTDAYALVSTNDYFENLSAEQIGGYSRKNYTIGNSALDDTFNNRSYIQKYFETYLGASHAYTDIAQIKKVNVNGSDFWMCHCYYYSSDYSVVVNDPKATLSGESYIYYTIYNGITYFINVTSVDMYLSSVKDASEFINNFYIGTRLQSGVKLVWIILALFVVADIILMFSAFFKINVEPAVIVERIVTHLRDIFLKKNHYTAYEFTDRLCEIELDRILERADIVEDEADVAFVKNERTLINLDDILDRYKPQKITYEYSPIKELDMILGRSPRPFVFKEKALVYAPVMSAMDDIFAGKYNKLQDEKTVDLEVKRLNAIAELSQSCSAPKDGGLSLKFDKFLSKLAESNSVARLVKRTKMLDRSGKKLLAAEAREYAKSVSVANKQKSKFESKYKVLEEKYRSIAVKTYVPDLVCENIREEDLLFNLDTILVRTLYSKLDNILGRVIWSAPRVSFGDYAQQLKDKSEDIERATDFRANLVEEYRLRLAVLPDKRHLFYISSPQFNLLESKIAQALYSIRNESINYIYNPVDELEVIETKNISNATSVGPNSYELYLKLEKTSQVVFYKISIFAKRIVNFTKVSVKSIVAAIGKGLSSAKNRYDVSSIDEEMTSRDEILEIKANNSNEDLTHNN